ncbi:MAG: L-rhamnose mutarotase [Alistipes sp.]|nr:L-rhamnose mutarotase [Alistipes sp.]
MDGNLKDGYTKRPAEGRKRFCQLLRLEPDTLDEYRHWHDSRNIWPEIPAGIRRAGILDMEIYVYGTTAVMILETPLEFDWDESFGRLAGYDRQAEWEDFVARFQQTGGGRRSDEKWQLAERIFSLEDALDSAVKK